MSAILRDLRYSLRTLRKRAGFTVATVLTLALGIGANAAIFSILNATLLNLPYTNPNKLVTLWESDAKEGLEQIFVSAPDFSDWQQSGEIFDGMALQGFDTPVLQVEGEPQRISTSQVSTNFFSLIGVQPMLGRSFLPEDGKPEQRFVAIISHNLWRANFHSDSRAAGKAIVIDNNTYNIVGVLPQSFEYFKATDIWVPLFLTPEDRDRGARHFFAIARLKDGIDQHEAETRLKAVSEGLQKEYPSTNRNWTVRVIALKDYLFRDMRTSLAILFGAVAFILLIACANVANLQLALMSGRQQEFATRLALGCVRGRLVVQLLLDGLLLAGAGGVVGLGLAYLVVQKFSSFVPEGNLPKTILLDARVLVFTFAITLLTALLSGALPAIGASKFNIIDALKQSKGRGGVRHYQLHRIFIVSEIALSLALLLGAGLLIKSFWLLQRISPGFDSRDTVTVKISLPLSEYRSKDQQATFFKHLLDKLAAAPGVYSVAATTRLPLAGSTMSFSFSVPSHPSLPRNLLRAQYSAISPDYFRTLGIPLLSGRAFAESDQDQASSVIIINQAMANRLFPGENPIGRQLKLDYGKPGPREIIGVVGDVKYTALNEPERFAVYVPYLQNPWSFMSITIRTKLPLQSIVPSIRHEVMVIDSKQPIEAVMTMDEIVQHSVSRPRFYAFVITIFAALALALAAIGVYGVSSYIASQRVQEIGIRMSLGAPASEIVRLFVREAARNTLVGIVLGLLGFAAVFKILNSFLYHTSWREPGVLMGAAALLAVTAIGACYFATLRASRIEPMTALRDQ